MRRNGCLWSFMLIGLGLLVLAAAGRLPAAESSGARAFPGAMPAPSRGDLPWRLLLPGFELAELPPTLTPAPEPGARDTVAPPIGGSARSAMIILRFDPTRYVFSLHMASEEGPSSLVEVVERHGLLAAVNAGMYLPDQITSTGHMRSSGHVNNPRVAGKFGAFLMANPTRPGLPPAVLLDRDRDDWHSAMEKYSLVIQNYRLTDTQGRILWPDNASAHSIAALGQDSRGRFLFILHREPISPARFAAKVLAMPLGVKSLMYLEGGTPAMLLVLAGGFTGQWSGSRFGGLIGGADSGWQRVPNVLGVRAKAGVH